MEVKPSAVGTKFSIRYALRPGVPIDDGIAKSEFFSAVRLQSEGDVAGIKELCEAEARGQGGEPR